jgi:twitching motility protein PilI
MNLRDLKDRPFELLRELERRGRAALADAADLPAGEEWIGIAFRVGPERFVVARDQVREVLPVPTTLTRVPGARSWLKGIASVRGHLLALTDLKALLGVGTAAKERQARALVVNHREVPAGVIVDEVLGFRRFLAGQYQPQNPATLIRAEAFLAGAYRDAGELWPVFDLHALVEHEQFQQAAE